MKIDFDGTEYEIESLSEVGKNTVNSLQFVEGKISELSNKKAVYNAAKSHYIAKLHSEIKEAEIEPIKD